VQRRWSDHTIDFAIRNCAWMRMRGPDTPLAADDLTARIAGINAITDAAVAFDRALELAPGLEPRTCCYRQERIVHGVLAGAVLAGQVRQLVQPLRS
jgi:hypothetical protein